VEFTGERYVPETDSPEISFIHWHRYLFAGQFVRDNVVLDIACGEGYGSFFLSQRAAKVTGVDVDTQCIAHAEKQYRNNNLSFTSGSVTNIPVGGSGVFDTIVSFETIEHVAEEEQKGFLKEVKRLLKADGTLLISTPNRLLCGDIPEYKNEYHVRELYQDEFVDMLSGHFRNVLLLGQNLYAISYLWDPERPGSSITEFRLDSSGKGYSPTEKPKELLYMVAVCSDRTIPEIAPSFLVDLSQEIFRSRFQLIRDLGARDTEISLLRQTLYEKEQQLANLEKAERSVSDSRGGRLSGYLGRMKKALAGKTNEKR
jgi:ubiquinone/menaquinone biosynthesis C-methylase UbiE